MKAVESHGDEFKRKVRTLIRGMTVLFHYSHLLNPCGTGRLHSFSFPNKLVRWIVPAFLMAMLVANMALVHRPVFAVLAVAQGLFYLAGLTSLAGVPGVRDTPAARIAGYFLNVNAAIGVAWWRYLRGERKEIWAPTRR
jgi:hypothetical protein